MDQDYESPDVSEPTGSSVEQGVSSQDERYHRIAEMAYFIAEKRGFRGGNPVEDWLEAEATIDSGQPEGQGEH